MLHSGLPHANELSQNRNLKKKIVNRQGKHKKIVFLFFSWSRGWWIPSDPVQGNEAVVFAISWVKCRLEGMILSTAFTFSWQWSFFLAWGEHPQIVESFYAQWCSHFLHKKAVLVGQLQVKSLQTQSLTHAESCSAHRSASISKTLCAHFHHLLD